MKEGHAPYGRQNDEDWRRRTGDGRQGIAVWFRSIPWVFGLTELHHNWRQVMSIAALTTTQLVAIIAVVVVVIAVIATLLFRRKGRTERLRGKFGEAEYARAVKEGGTRRRAEAGLDERTQRVEGFHIQPLAPGDRARFVDSWRGVQTRFIDGPAGAVTAADQLLTDVMVTRGYPVSDFEQRAADISVDHPLVLENYRTAHEIALRQTKGQASTEELRQAMVQYRTLFEELVSEQEMPPTKAAS